MAPLEPSSLVWSHAFLCRSSYWLVGLGPRARSLLLIRAASQGANVSQALTLPSTSLPVPALRLNVSTPPGRHVIEAQRWKVSTPRPQKIAFTQQVESNASGVDHLTLLLRALSTVGFGLKDKCPLWLLLMGKVETRPDNKKQLR